MPLGHPTPIDVDDSIIKMRLSPDFVNHRQVADAHGVSVRTVERAIDRGRKRGIEIPKMDQPGPITPEEEARILFLLKDGTPYAEVARTTGRNLKTLCKKYPGYAMTHSEIASINHMTRKFERLLEALGLADTGHAAH